VLTMTVASQYFMATNQRCIYILNQCLHSLGFLQDAGIFRVNLDFEIMPNNFGISLIQKICKILYHSRDSQSNLRNKDHKIICLSRFCGHCALNNSLITYPHLVCEVTARHVTTIEKNINFNHIYVVPFCFLSL
jgi:hypothetical protein